MIPVPVDGMVLIMDYKQFFADVENWIYECNNQAAKLGFMTDEYWNWVVKSLEEFTKKYNNEKLAMKQASMLLEWLDELWKDMKNA